MTLALPRAFQARPGASHAASASGCDTDSGQLADLFGFWAKRTHHPKRIVGPSKRYRTSARGLEVFAREAAFWSNCLNEKGTAREHTCAELIYMLTSHKCMASNVAYRGIRFTVIYAIRTDESIPALDFFEGLDRQWQARFLTLYTRLGDTGRISNPEQFSKFGDDFWEFKAFRYRMPCYYREGKQVVITHGFIKKKEGRAPEQENTRANDIRAEHERRLLLKNEHRRTK
jgi:Phage derived protein Gp49-like (DUF891)